eukprot:TRINITY_DN31426_c0_g1_i1.p1 TRINITY_DN31426_c0_g1~~TRINITY_DN31426_c0_g1_i1.p1  ORF type:complete len:240 (+),score=33.78 TRINITY_DN31426_c0_g1_i1:61-780(+)
MDEIMVMEIQKGVGPWGLIPACVGKALLAMNKTVQELRDEVQSWGKEQEMADILEKCGALEKAFGTQQLSVPRWEDQISVSPSESEGGTASPSGSAAVPPSRFPRTTHTPKLEKSRKASLPQSVVRKTPPKPVVAPLFLSAHPLGPPPNLMNLVEKSLPSPPSPPARIPEEPSFEYEKSQTEVNDEEENCGGTTPMSSPVSLRRPRPFHIVQEQQQQQLQPVKKTQIFTCLDVLDILPE